MKKLFAFAILLTSSLAGVAKDATDLEDKYYTGLNFGAGWDDGFKMKPGVVFGYHYNKKSKFELEVLSEIRSLQNIGAALLANYRYYPNPDTNPVKLYVGVGLGGYLQIVPFGSSKGLKDLAMEEPRKMRSILGDVFDFVGDLVVGTKKREKKDTKKPSVKEKSKPPAKDKTKPSVKEKPTPTAKDKLKPPVEDEPKPPTEEEPKLPVEEKPKPTAEEEPKLLVKDEIKPSVKNEITPPLTREITTTVADERKILPLIDKILGSISYKLKVGVDYEITPQIVGTVGITVGGQLSGLKALKMPDATLKVGIRYNF
ncbi:hypothetical protein [Wolbachia pipientis]|uniref:hypothetical protein n=1 Tax=Wolbachia pipientis TaxID=955 RepID=UPI002030BA09|nr:hypothetical protein [Wolbachia pipientis]MCM1002315.1 hypothetical protein [Wolbachia pipientis]